LCQKVFKNFFHNLNNFDFYANKKGYTIKV
jgi:hypothetical protein